MHRDTRAHPVVEEGGAVVARGDFVRREGNRVA